MSDKTTCLFMETLQRLQERILAHRVYNFGTKDLTFHARYQVSSPFLSASGISVISDQNGQSHCCGNFAIQESPCISKAEPCVIFPLRTCASEIRYIPWSLSLPSLFQSKAKTVLLWCWARGFPRMSFGWICMLHKQINNVVSSWESFVVYYTRTKQSLGFSPLMLPIIGSEPSPSLSRRCTRKLLNFGIPMRSYSVAAPLESEHRWICRQNVGRPSSPAAALQISSAKPAS